MEKTITTEELVKQLKSSVPALIQDYQGNDSKRSSVDVFFQYNAIEAIRDESIVFSKVSSGDKITIRKSEIKNVSIRDSDYCEDSKVITINFNDDTRWVICQYGNHPYVKIDEDSLVDASWLSEQFKRSVQTSLWFGSSDKIKSRTVYDKCEVVDSEDYSVITVKLYNSGDEGNSVTLSLTDETDILMVQETEDYAAFKIIVDELPFTTVMVFLNYQIVCIPQYIYDGFMS
jgi:hypothetical protein